MKTTLTVLFASAGLIHAQMGRTVDWPTYGGDVQRSGFEKSDSRFKKDDIAKTFQLLWKMQQRGAPRLMAPVIIGNLIGYRGFKELAFVGGSDDGLYVMDADMNRMYWQTKFVPPADPPAPTAACPGGMTAMPTMMALGFRRAATPAAPAPAAPATAAPSPAAPKPAAAPAAARPNPMFGPRAIYTISSDGMLRRINVANGGEAGVAFQVVPANARTSTLSMNDSVIYATTSNGCGGVPNAVWAIDLSNPDASAAPAVKTLMTNGGNFLGIGGPVIDNAGTVYVQTGDGPSDPESGKYSNTILALTPKTLASKGYFIDPANGPESKSDLNSVTPVAFEASEGHQMIVSASKDGRLYLLDSNSFAGDHKTPLATSPKIAPGDGGLWGGLTSWTDANGARFVLATVWGKANGHGGSVAAFKLDNLDSKPVFTPLWTVKDLIRPVPPVVASGAAFILSSGEGHKNAVLHAVDAMTGAALWSTKDQITAPGALAPLTVANGRVYLVTADSTLWVFGVPIEL